MSALPRTLVLVGAGKMGSALLSGWREIGLDPTAMVALDPAPSAETREWCRRAGVRLSVPGPGIEAPDVLVLALKPQTFDAGAAELAYLAGEATLVLSIMAGKTIDDIAQRLPRARAIVRAMPNTPAAIRRGVTGAVAGAGTSQAQRVMADGLLSAIGGVEWLADERLMDAVTALSGSGPAYVFYLAECLAEAGVAAGLPADVAQRLARATLEGAAALMASEAAVSPADLRRNVTSPGGTTAAALQVLSAPDGLPLLMRRAVEAARRRAAELSG